MTERSSARSSWNRHSKGLAVEEPVEAFTHYAFHTGWRNAAEPGTARMHPRPPSDGYQPSHAGPGNQNAHLDLETFRPGVQVDGDSGYLFNPLGEGGQGSVDQARSAGT